MIIKIDVDGVLRDIVKKMCEVYNKDFNETVTSEEITDYHMNGCFNKIDESKVSKHNYFFKRNSFEIFFKSELINGVKEYIDKLHKAGHTIAIVSYQTSVESMFYTLKWLESNEIYYDSIHFTYDKWMVKGDYLIDDNLEHLIDKRETSNKILMDAPYNRNAMIEDNIKKVKTFKEAYNIINNG